MYECICNFIAYQYQQLLGSAQSMSQQSTVSHFGGNFDMNLSNLPNNHGYSMDTIFMGLLTLLLFALLFTRMGQPTSAESEKLRNHARPQYDPDTYFD